MTRSVKIGEARPHPSALLTRIASEGEHAARVAALRRERAGQTAVTTAEILSWRHHGHVR